MKRFSVLIALALLVPAALFGARPAQACDHARACSGTCFGSHTRFTSRHDVRDAHLAITTRNRDAVMLLTDEVVAVQLSDRMLHRIDREMRQEQGDEEDNALARAIKSAVFGGVRSLLDHSAECRIRDLRDVEYRGGRLLFTTEQGGTVFADFDLDDHDVMEGFSDGDAQSFVREFHRLKGQVR